MLYLTESQVEALLPMPDAVNAVEEALRALGSVQAVNSPRQRVVQPPMVMHLMGAGWSARGYVGYKAYTSGPQGTCFWVHLYDANTGAWVAAMQADRLGQRRTGAASGVATRYLANPSAETVGMIGTGWQAESQLEAIAVVRPLRSARCYGRNPEHTRAFAARMSERLHLPVTVADTADQAVRDAQIVVTATSASEPVVHGEWLAPGAHVNAVGANWIGRRELDDAVIRRTAGIWVDSVEQAKLESGDLVSPVTSNLITWEHVRELAPLVAGRAPGRVLADDITLFKSHGIALEDVAVAALVYERAREWGVGRELGSL